MIMSNRALKYYIALAVVLILLALPFYLKREKESAVYTRSLMGTIVRLTLMEGDRGRFDAASEAAFSEIERLETLFSSYIPTSDVSRVNASAGGPPVEVAPEVYEVAQKALHISKISNGAFDPTVGALGRIWGPSGESGRVPSEEEIKKLLPLVDYKNVEAEGNTLRHKKKGMALNLGGVAKGYIVGKAVEALKANGVVRGIVHAGGDMYLFNEGGGAPFTIGIQDPREKRLLGEAFVDRGAVATSGDYERYFIKDGVRYHHIIDPATGFPAARSRSVTIVALDATVADGVSTAVFVMGPIDGMRLIEELDSVEGVIVDSEGKVTVSSGFKGRIFD